MLQIFIQLYITDLEIIILPDNVGLFLAWYTKKNIYIIPLSRHHSKFFL
jgi:hypothetical protein